MGKNPKPNDGGTSQEKDRLKRTGSEIFCSTQLAKQKRKNRYNVHKKGAGTVGPHGWENVEVKRRSKKGERAAIDCKKRLV